MQDVYKSEQAQEVIKYIRGKYGDELEFLWRNSNNAIWRNAQNRKWYAALLMIGRDKLGLNSTEVVEIIDLRFNKNEALSFAESNDNVYPGYHMNKNNWITVILDGSMKTEKIFGLIDNSYGIAERK